MLLVEAPREAAVPPCAAPLDIPMSTLTKLNFTDYSAKVKPYDNQSEQRDSRLNYEQALASVARLSYEQSVPNATKLHYGDQNRLAYDPTVDPMCDPSFILPTGLYTLYVKTEQFCLNFSSTNLIPNKLFQPS